MSKSQFAGVILFVLLLLSSSSVIAQSDGIDTTRVRKTSPVKKSTGEIIADIPGEILKFPFYTAELVTHTIIMNPPVSEITKLIDLGAEAKPYLPVAGYSSNAGLKFGFALRKLKNIAPTDHVKGKWYYSTNDYQSYMLKSRFERLFTDHLGLDLYFRYKKRPRESFYGVGMESLEHKEANYTWENTEFKIEIPIRTYDRFYFNLIGGYKISNVYDGRDPDLVGDLDSLGADPDFALEDGRLDNSRYVTFGASMEWDGRNNRGQPSKGIHALGRFVRYTGVDISDGLDFSEYAIDLRHYMNIWRKRILALRVYVHRFDENNDNSRATPIYLTSRLGGRTALRGYSSGRYIDNDLVFVSAEYRYPIWDMIDAFVFLDEGRVYNRLTDEAFFADWKYSAGFGLRVWNPRTVLATLQVARGDETTKVYFELGAVW